MDREIKFRAWLPSQNEMSAPFWLNALFHMNELAISDLINEEANPVWLQYAGLVDKNGREIYEGDIVSSSKMYGEVCWAPHRAGWGIHGQLIERDWDKCEVIGNIYENPELLTEAK